MIVPAGASYSRRIAKDPPYTNAYNLVHLDLEAGRGVVYLRRWSDPRNEWIADADSHDAGMYPFSLPKGLSAPQAAAHAATPAAPDAHRLAQVEEKYRRLLLETCDIINIANLPEQDRHLAQRQLELRRLYVPLRVWVERQAAEAPGEPGEEDRLWEAVERRRAAARSGASEDERSRQRLPVGERLTQARRLVVLGDPGAGKTTLTRWIATAYLLRLKNDPDWQALPDVQSLPAADWLPIIVRCRDLDEDCVKGSLDDMLAHTLRRAELSQAEAADLGALLRARLEAGQAILMLDGLDEITDPQARTSFCQQVERMAVAYPEAPVIATSRIVGYREMGYRLGWGFEHLTLADLTEEEKDDFARRWCELTELPERRAAAAEELIRDIHSAERIERLTGNPMLLTTMALVKRKIGKLPNRRADLYWEAVQVLLNWRREVDEPLDWHEAIPQLEYLAYAMCDRGVQQLWQDEVLALLARMREEYPHVHAASNRSPEEFLTLLEARTGILVEAGHARHLGTLTPVYEFRHLTFQEYLAARALVDGRFPGRDATQSLAAQVAPLAGRTTDAVLTKYGVKETTVVESWREALRLCVAMCNDADVDDLLLATLTPLEGEPPATDRARAILAALCLADEPNASEQAAEQVFRAMAAQAGGNDGLGQGRTGMDAAVREVAGTRWAGALRACLVEEFCRLKGRNRESPGRLGGMVGAVGAPRSAQPLTDWLAEQAGWVQGGEESKAIESALAVAWLFAHGRTQRLSEVRPPTGLAPALLAKLSSSAPLAHAAAWALASLNIGILSPPILQPTAGEIDRLVAVVSDEHSDSSVVVRLARILGQKKVTAAIVPLIARLEDTDAGVRLAAAEALDQIGSETAVAPLIARLEDADAGVRRVAARALGRIGSEAAAVPLIARLWDVEAEVWRIAAMLGRIDSEVAMPLLSLLEDTDAQVQSAVAVMGGIGSGAAATPLIARLEDAEARARLAAARAPGRIGSEAAAPLIVRLEDADAGVRRAAAEALGRIGSETAVAPLIARLEDADGGVRLAAAEALGRIGSEAAVAPLIARLEDANGWMQSVAAFALSRIGSEAALTPLIARLEDADGWVQSAAAFALGQIGSKAAVAPLIARLENADGRVRHAAAFALGRIGSEVAAEPLIARLEDADAEVRRAAAEALGRIGSEAAAEPLIARLEDAKWIMQHETAMAFGDVLRDLGCLDAAAVAYRRIGELNPEQAEPISMLGALYELAGRPEEALREYQRAVDLNPKAGSSHASLASVLRQLNRPEEAEAHLTLARALIAPDDDYNRACLEAIVGDAEAALTHLSSALIQDRSRRAWAARDPNLASLHGDPRFEALVGGAKRRGDRGSSENPNEGVGTAGPSGEFAG